MKKGKSVWLPKRNSVMSVETVVLVNNTYIIIAGFEYYHELFSRAEGTVKTYQFLSGLPSAATPLEVETSVTVSKMNVAGVLQFTCEKQEELYCY